MDLIIHNALIISRKGGGMNNIYIDLDALEEQSEHTLDSKTV